ncbi:MAG: UDP-2,3-diacylglucosamine hydrolase [Pseudomonadota bacterium]|jgi:UDP-2,3-diacylglucosamine hydrolase
MTATVLPFQVFEAPEHWRTVDFISDLHLQDKDLATFQVWQRYMQSTTADAVFVLGDLFEVWVGDDAAPKHRFLQQCASVLKDCASKRHVGFMRGNRDFLVGLDFLKSCGVHNLQDPTALHFASQHWLLSHGDEGCLDDTNYQAFRSMVRQADWQHQFLAKPLEEREEIARQLRAQSQQHKNDSASVYADVDEAWAIAALELSHSTCLLHGHTHRPADHVLSMSSNLQRRVLSDWDVQSTKPRAEVLRWSANGQVERINLLDEAQH